MQRSHGISIGIERRDSEFYVVITARGTLTHEDYRSIVPMLESALAAVESPHIKALVDARDLEGWELRAAWDDLKLGLKHGNKFDRIAILGSKTWQQVAAKIGTWFVAGEVELFNNETAALKWLNE